MKMQLRFIRRCEAKYDLIIVDSSDPFGPSEGLFTREFLWELLQCAER